MKHADSSHEPSPHDATFRHARREALLILIAGGLCLIWTVGYCAIAGYDVPADQVQTILGMPRWIFWGVLAPWIAATIFSVWFGLFYIADDDLGQDRQADDSEEVQ